MTVFDTSRTETTYSLGRVVLADIPDKRLRKLAGYWYSQRAERILPSRDDVDPLDLPSGVLPNIILLDIVGSARYRRFRFRLVGTAIYTHVGRELTGLHIDEALPEPYLSYVSFTHTTAADQRWPVYSETLYHDQGNFVNGITLPAGAAAGQRPRDRRHDHGLPVLDPARREKQLGGRLAHRAAAYPDCRTGLGRAQLLDQCRQRLDVEPPGGRFGDQRVGIGAMLQHLYRTIEQIDPRAGAAMRQQRLAGPRQQRVERLHIGLADGRAGDRQEMIFEAQRLGLRLGAGHRHLPRLLAVRAVVDDRAIAHRRDLLQ